MKLYVSYTQKNESGIIFLHYLAPFFPVSHIPFICMHSTSHQHLLCKIYGMVSASICGYGYVHGFILLHCSLEGQTHLFPISPLEHDMPSPRPQTQTSYYTSLTFIGTLLLYTINT